MVAGSGAAFVEQKLAERDARHERMGDSRYVLEPHIKEGKGGLRDLQTLFWISKYLYQVKEIGELVARGCSPMPMSGNSARREFSLDRSLPPALRRRAAGRAPGLQLPGGHRQSAGLHRRISGRGVERFMKHYFRVTKTVGELTRVLCAVLEDQHRKTRLRFRMPSLSRDPSSAACPRA